MKTNTIVYLSIFIEKRIFWDFLVVYSKDTKKKVSIMLI